MNIDYGCLMRKTQSAEEKNILFVTTSDIKQRREMGAHPTLRWMTKKIYLPTTRALLLLRMLTTAKKCGLCLSNKDL